MVGGIVQWSGCQSLTSGLSLTCDQSWIKGEHFVGKLKLSAFSAPEVTALWCFINQFVIITIIGLQQGQLSIHPLGWKMSISMDYGSDDH